MVSELILVGADYDAAHTRIRSTIAGDEVDSHTAVINYMFETGLSAASHTIDVRWKVGGSAGGNDRVYITW